MVILGDRMEHSPATFRDLAPGKYPLRIMLPDFDPIETELSIGSRETSESAGFQIGAEQRVRAAKLDSHRRDL